MQGNLCSCPSACVVVWTDSTAAASLRVCFLPSQDRRGGSSWSVMENPCWASSVTQQSTDSSPRLLLRAHNHKIFIELVIFQDLTCCLDDHMSHPLLANWLVFLVELWA